jgi:hypothetical protein
MGGGRGGLARIRQPPEVTETQARIAPKSGKWPGAKACVLCMMTCHAMPRCDDKILLYLSQGPAQKKKRIY